MCLSEDSHFSDLSYRFQCHEHMHIYDTFGRGLCVCLCVFLHDNLKTIADICFLPGNYIDWSLHTKLICHHQGHFSEGSRGIQLPIRSRG